MNKRSMALAAAAVIIVIFLSGCISNITNNAQAAVERAGDVKGSFEDVLSRVKNIG